MFPPNFGMKDVKVGSGDVFRKDNIEEFLTFVSKLYTHDKRSIVELTNSYDSAISCLVARLEKRFVNLNPILQQMFLKIDSMDREKEKDFVLGTLLHQQSSSFLAPLPGTLELQQGESHTLNHFTLLVLFLVSLFCLLQNFKTQKN